MESERGVYRVMSSREAQLLVGECSSQEEGGMRGRGTCPILIPKLTERIKEILRRRLPFSYYCTRSVFIYIRTVRSIKSKRHHIGSIPPSPTALEKKKKKKKKPFLFFFPLPDKLLHCKSNRTQAVGPIGESSSGRKDFITPK